jgi:hypothetical protein
MSTNTPADRTTEAQTYTTATKPCPSYGRGATIRATVTTKRGYFSITGEIRDERQHPDPVIACGCIHDEIREHYPAIAPLIPLHLSDSATGEPMHAEANGLYWLKKAAGIPSQYGPAQTPEQCREILARHLRTDDRTTGHHIAHARAAYDTARATVATSAHVTARTQAEQHAAGLDAVQHYFAGALARHRKTWQDQADAAHAIISALTASQA